MIDGWIAEVITTLRIMGISQKEFARLCGYSEPYMSQILRGHKFSDQAKDTIQAALQQLTKRNA